MSNYTDLEIYKMANDLAIQIHHLSLKMPKYELYEQGSQVRRASKSIKDNIAEGYGRRRYRAEFIRFLNFEHASCDEVHSQLTMINKFHINKNPVDELISNYNILCGKINNFISYSEKNRKTNKSNS